MRRIALVTVTTATALTATILLPALPAQATYSGSNGRISFFQVVGNGDASEIFSAAADGSDVTQLTHSGVDGDGNPRNSLFSDWSPNGSEIAFDSDRVDADGDQDVVQVYVMDADGGNVRQVTAGPGFHGDPAWSPNGQRLAIEADWNSYPADQGIWTLPSGSVMADKAAAVRVTTFPDMDGYDGEPQYSPDGAWIVFTRFAGCTYHPNKDKQPSACQQAIFKVWTDGTHLTQLTGWSRQNSAPDWSPDGKQIVFDSGDVGRQGSTGDVWVMNANGSGKRRLTHTPKVSRAAGFQIANNPVWSPDGTQIIYVRWHGDDPTTVDRINSDGSGQTTLYTADVFLNKVDWGAHS